MELVMNDRERDRLSVLAQIGRGGLTQRQAAGVLRLSARQGRGPRPQAPA